MVVVTAYYSIKQLKDVLDLATLKSEVAVGIFNLRSVE